MEISAVPSKRKKYLNEIGRLLAGKHGKKKAYKIKAIQLACDKSKYNRDFGTHNFAWIASVFAKEIEFNKYYEKIDLAVDYSKMKKIMLKGTSFEKVLNPKNDGVKGKFNMNDASMDNLIDPSIIG